ncbi:MAG: choice-of-anchor D domain-containing protein [Kofleriaceae bacterium]
MWRAVARRRALVIAVGCASTLAGAGVASAADAAFGINPSPLTVQCNGSGTAAVQNNGVTPIEIVAVHQAGCPGYAFTAEISSPLTMTNPGVLGVTLSSSVPTQACSYWFDWRFQGSGVVQRERFEVQAGTSCATTGNLVLSPATIYLEGVVGGPAPVSTFQVSTIAATTLVVDGPYQFNPLECNGSTTSCTIPGNTTNATRSISFAATGPGVFAGGIHDSASTGYLQLFGEMTSAIDHEDLGPIFVGRNRGKLFTLGDTSVSGLSMTAEDGVLLPEGASPSLKLESCNEVAPSFDAEHECEFVTPASMPTVELRCKPDDAVPLYGRLHVTSDDGIPFPRVDVTCAGVKTRVGVAGALSPIIPWRAADGGTRPVLDFGAATLHLNAGNRQLVIETVEAEDQPGVAIVSGPEFSIASTVTSDAGRTVTFSIMFTPSANTSASGTLQLTLGTETFEIGLAGTTVVADASAEPPEVDLGQVCVGSAAVATPHLDNVGSAPLNLSSTFVSGGNGVFTVTPPSPGVIAVGTQVAATVTATPMAAGTATATLVWRVRESGTAAGGTSQIDVPLLVEGIDDGFAVSPASLEFGLVYLGVGSDDLATSPVHRYDLDDCAATTVWSPPEVSGAGASFFPLTPGVADSVTGQLPVDVRYLPTSPGDHAATLDHGGAQVALHGAATLGPLPGCVDAALTHSTSFAYGNRTGGTITLASALPAADEICEGYELTYAGTPPTTLAPGAVVPLVARVTASQWTWPSCQIELGRDEGGAPVYVELAAGDCTGSDGALVVTPSPTPLLTAPIGAAALLSLTAANDGGLPLTFLVEGVTGPWQVDVCTEAACTVAGRRDLPLQVTFRPTSAADDGAELVLSFVGEGGELATVTVIGRVSDDDLDGADDTTSYYSCGAGRGAGGTLVILVAIGAVVTRRRRHPQPGARA